MRLPQKNMRRIGWAWLVFFCVCILLITRHYTFQYRIERYLSSQANEIRLLAAQQDWPKIRLTLSSSASLHSVAVWLDFDTWLFPSDATFTHEMDTLAYQSGLLFQDVANQATPSNTVFLTSRRDVIVYCNRAVLMVCLIADTAQTASQTGLSQSVFSRIIANEAKGFLVGLFVVAILWGCALLMVFRKAQKRETSPCTDAAECFTMADMLVFPSQCRIRRNARDIHVNQRDLAMLTHFYAHPNEVISKQTLYDIGWGRDFVNSSRALEQHIINLRKKLDPSKTLPTIIDTVHGQGYRFPSGKK